MNYFKVATAPPDTNMNVVSGSKPKKTTLFNIAQQGLEIARKYTKASEYHTNIWEDISPSSRRSFKSSKTGLTCKRLL